MSIKDMEWIERGRRLWPPIKMTFLIVLWISLFIVGYHVDSEPIRLALADSTLLSKMAFDEFLIRLMKTLFTWTWPNCLMLCCLAAVIGDIGRQVSDSPQTPDGNSPDPVGNAADNKAVTEYRPALSRAFFVFILLLSGQLILGGSLGNPVAPSVPDTSTVVSGAVTDSDSDRSRVTANENAMVATDAARYFRIASFVSFLGFMVGYNPAVFRDFLQRAL